MIQYKFQSVGFLSAGGKERICPVAGKMVGVKEIAREIEAMAGIPAIRTMDALAAFVEAAARHFEQGDQVRIDGLGAFKPTLGLEDGRVVAKRLSFCTSNKMRDRMKDFPTEAI